MKLFKVTLEIDPSEYVDPYVLHNLIKNKLTDNFVKVTKIEIEEVEQCEQ